MLIKTLLLLTLSLTLFTACSSSDDPREIAVDICQYGIDSDVDGLKEYASTEFSLELDKIEEIMDIEEDTDEGEDLLDIQEDKADSINCLETTKISTEDNKTFHIINEASQQNYKLKRVEGKWKMFK